MAVGAWGCGLPACGSPGESSASARAAAKTVETAPAVNASASNHIFNLFMLPPEFSPTMCRLLILRIGGLPNREKVPSGKTDLNIE